MALSAWTVTNDCGIIQGMELHYTIGQLARAAGVPTSTVRYYERIGLLQPAGRTVGNYRLYGQEALERLHFIRAAQATGFALEDITTLLQLQDNTASVCQHVQVRIAERLSDLERRIAALRQVQQVLQTTLKRCRETQQRGRCQLIDTLTATAASHPEDVPHNILPPQISKALP
jgi:MerR family mercuric resistance operon transcriptional regulator